MKRLIVFAIASAGLLHAQLGHTTDWFAYAGDAQHDGWEKNEQRFLKDDVKSFQLLWQRKLDNSKSGVGALLPPVVLGNLIGYRGFKELAFVAGSDNTLWSIDSDLDRMYWVKHFDIAHKRGKNCNTGLTADPALPPPVVFRLPSATPTQTPPRRSLASGFTHPHPVYLLTGDGMLHKLNQSDGSEMGSPIQFVPPGVAAQSLNVFEDTVYTTTQRGCGQDAAIWSVDTGDPAAKVKSFKFGPDITRVSDVALSTDGKRVVQTVGGTLYILNEDLSVDKYFSSPESNGRDTGVMSPVIFTFKGQEMVATANPDGRIYLVSAVEAGGDDHHKYAARSAILRKMDGDKSHRIGAGLASWEDTDGSRFLLAPVWGPLSAEVQAAIPGTDAPHGSVVVFKVEDKNGAIALNPVWVSRDLESPSAPVIAKGVVFALANGKFSRSGKPSKDTHATLYAFDGLTGKEMYSTGDQVTSPGNLAGMTIANGRIYFATVDNTVQVFGKYLER